MLGLLAAIPGVGPVYTIAASVIGAILRCTICMIVLAVGIAWIAGNIHGHKKANAAWSAKWAAAEAEAERARLARDAFAKAKIEAEAKDRIADVSARAEQLEAKVRQYEQDEELRRATPNGAAALDACLTDQSDDRWLSDLKRQKRRSGAVGRSKLAERLRSHFAGSPGSGKH